MYHFESFTEDAKKSLSIAQEEAEHAHHPYIGTEHLLLGLLRLPSGTAHTALRELGIDVGAVRHKIVAALGQQERTPSRQQIIPTLRVKHVIEIAFDQARRMGTNHVDSGHILIGLTIEGEGIAAHVLQDMGAGQEQVITAVERAMSATTSGRMEREVPRGSDAEALLRLLRLPHVANLLRAKGIVDVEGLAARLEDPPPEVVRLRLQSQDLLKQLERAEQDWLRKLTE